MPSIEEIAVPHTARAFRAMCSLRPQLASEGEFVERVDAVQRPAGYRLAGVFDDEADAVAVIGFRIGANLAWGRFLYLDDLVTLPEARGRGHARALLEWVQGEAIRAGCDQLHLDSGLGPERAAAHRLYESAGWVVTSHHFSRRL